MSINSLINSLPSSDGFTPPAPIEETEENENPEQQPQDPPEGQGDVADEEGYEPDYDTSFIPEEYRPTKFANTEEELKFYREKYAGSWQHMSSPAFVEKFIETYQDRLASSEQEVSNFKEMLKAFKSDPQTFLATQIPEYAEKIGIGRVYSDDEIDQSVDAKIAEEFGEAWKESFDPNDIYRKSSLSSKILRRRQELETSYEQHNKTVAENKEKFLSTLGTKTAGQAPPPQEVLESQADLLVAQYEEHFKPAGFTEEEYVEFIERGNNYTPTVADIYNMMHFEELVAQERAEAIEEGRKIVLDELRRAGKIAQEDYRLRVTETAAAPQRKFMGMNISI
jgi:hypothetical protein